MLASVRNGTLRNRVRRQPFHVSASSRSCSRSIYPVSVGENSFGASGLRFYPAQRSHLVSHRSPPGGHQESGRVVGVPTFQLDWGECFGVISKLWDDVLPTTVVADAEGVFWPERGTCPRLRKSSKSSNRSLDSPAPRRSSLTTRCSRAEPDLHHLSGGLRRVHLTDTLASSASSSCE